MKDKQRGKRSVFLSLLRQIFCLVPIFRAFSFIGLDYTRISFPVSETLSGGVGVIMYLAELKKMGSSQKKFLKIVDKTFAGMIL